MKHKEIEIKWLADHVNRDDFNKKIRTFLKDNDIDFTFLSVNGPDTYYRNSAGYVARHRFGQNTNELTVKLRLGKKGIKIRTEVNIPLSKDASPIDVQAFMNGLGFSLDVDIKKSCDIYFIKSQKADIDIVWYKVSSSGRRPRVFIEVEVGQLGKENSLKILSKWAKTLKKMFKLKDESQFSLYEIYSGQTYRHK